MLLIPITLVLFILLGVILANELALAGAERSIMIISSTLLGLIAAAAEFYTSIKRIHKNDYIEETETNDFKDKQRKMILEAFGDDLEAMDDE